MHAGAHHVVCVTVSAVECLFTFLYLI